MTNIKTKRKRRKNDNEKHDYKADNFWLFLVTALVIGVVSGYAWRMTQVPSIETAIVEALNGCNQLQTEELIVMPTADCKRLKTALVGLRTGTFNYYNTRGDK